MMAAFEQTVLSIMWRIAVILVLSAAIAAGALADEEPLRTWRYDRGTVEARLVKAVRSTVVLERGDGKRMVLSRKLLSPDDQAYLDASPATLAPPPISRAPKQNAAPELPEPVPAEKPRTPSNAPAQPTAPLHLEPSVPASTSPSFVVAGREPEPSVTRPAPSVVAGRSAAQSLRGSGREALDDLRARQGAWRADPPGWLRDKVYLGLAVAPLSALLAALFLRVAYKWVVRAELRYGRAYLASLLGKYIGGGVCLAGTFVPGRIPGIPDTVGLHLLALSVAFLVVSLFLGMFLKRPDARRLGLWRSFIALAVTSVMLFAVGVTVGLLLTLTNGAG